MTRFAFLTIALAACAAEGTGATRGPAGLDMDAGEAMTRQDAAASVTDAGEASRADAGQAGDAGCDMAVPIEAEIIGDPPDMLLVVDISSSMLLPADFANPLGPNKWSVMRPALEDVTRAYNARINFGLELYPAAEECGSSIVSVDIAPMNAEPVAQGLADRGPFPEAATPTHVALEEARGYFAGREPNPIGRYVLLATDGLPNCNPTVDDSGRGPSIAAVEALAGDGIRTFVLGFGGIFGADPTTLRDLATAGRTARHYTATDAMSLGTALSDIAAEIAVPSCRVQLAGAPRDPALFLVDLDGRVVPRNPARTSGWDFDASSNTITFYGDDCAELETGRVTSVNVDFGCPGPLI